MILDAERRLGPDSKQEPDGYVVYEMKALLKAAAAGEAPKAALERHPLKLGQVGDGRGAAMWWQHAYGPVDMAPGGG
jgi:hypothetical protein